jgi:hypothetical protein
VGVDMPATNLNPEIGHKLVSSSSNQRLTLHCKKVFTRAAQPTQITDYAEPTEQIQAFGAVT